MPSRRAQRALAAALIATLAAVAASWGAWALSSSRHWQLFGKLVTRVETADSVVALTFDDGPVSRYTDSVLAVLADSNVRATFFVVGLGLAGNPEIGRRIVTAGHELGNHSYSHQRMLLKSPGFIRDEIDRTDSLIRVTGQTTAVRFRPPYGKRLVVRPILWI
jgi:peptidoglycan/xylan/chitin deacetylase (PgdA/CDA1 family)